MSDGDYFNDFIWKEDGDIQEIAPDEHVTNIPHPHFISIASNIQGTHTHESSRSGWRSA